MKHEQIIEKLLKRVGELRESYRRTQEIINSYQKPYIVSEPLPHEKDRKAVLNDNSILSKLGNGNIANGKKRFKQLLTRKLYRIEELNEDEIEALLDYGYTKSNPRKKNLIVRNEKGYFEYVICLLNENESVQHMRDKELIASLNRNISEIEWLVPGTQNRIDVVFNLNGKKIGIEIQNSSLEYSRLQEKIELLEKHFDQWFFIASRNLADNYYYLGTNKGKVTIMKEAVKEIIEILRKNSPISTKAK